MLALLLSQKNFPSETSGLVAGGGGGEQERPLRGDRRIVAENIGETEPGGAGSRCSESLFLSQEDGPGRFSSYSLAVSLLQLSYCEWSLDFSFLGGSWEISRLQPSWHQRG